ncbi:hypothetical protein TYRP_012949 [Tyrophagus putrescentiae]|nr:hypothetical protein TYRP_012949 [Tyrophagus putrescentiae]
MSIYSMLARKSATLKQHFTGSGATFTLSKTEQASSTNLYIENGPYRSGNALKRQRMLGRK